MTQYLTVAGSLSNKTGTYWQMANDAAHKSIGITTISHTDTYVQINHPAPPGKRITKVVSLTATPDETFASKGYLMGCSVDLEKSRLSIGHAEPISDFIYYKPTTGEWKSLAGRFDLQWDPTTKALLCRHPGDVMHSRAVSVQAQRVNPSVPTVDAFSPQYTDTQFPIQFSTPAGVLHSQPHSSMQVAVTRYGNRQLRPIDVLIPMSNIWIHGIFEMEDK